MLADSGSNLILWLMTGTGFFTNDRQITGALSTATADVNTASTTKNLDYNFYHGFLVNSWKITKQLLVSSDKTDANTQELLFADDVAAGNNMGLAVFGVDTSYIQVQTGSEGLVYCSAAGAFTALDNEDYYYRFIVRLMI